jgi:hypothetical protein
MALFQMTLRRVIREDNNTESLLTIILAWKKCKVASSATLGFEHTLLAHHLLEKVIIGLMPRLKSYI